MKLKRMKKLIGDSNVTIKTKKHAYDDMKDVPEKVFEKEVKDIYDKGDTTVIVVGKGNKTHNNTASSDWDSLLQSQQEMEKVFDNKSNNKDSDEKISKAIKETKEELKEINKDNPRKTNK